MKKEKQERGNKGKDEMGRNGRGKFRRGKEEIS